MNVDYIVKIEVPTTTLKQCSTDQYETVVGTGYPIRDGLVLTAQHVVFPEDRDEKKPIKLIWKCEDNSKATLESYVDKIELSDAKFDIALLACDTSELNLPPIILSPMGQLPEDGKRWKSHGYPTAGKEAGVRIKSPAGGTFYSPNPSDFIQWLSSDGNVTDNALWQGMSGAPVFDESNRLTAVIIKTPAEYLNDQGVLKPVFGDRLISASIPYLLTVGKWDSFREAVNNKALAEIQLPTSKLEDDFEEWLISKVGNELNSLETKSTVLHEGLCRVLGKAFVAGENAVIARALLDESLEIGIDHLAAVSADCLLESGDLYSTNNPLDFIRNTAENILGWLVLRAIDENQLQTILPLCTHSSSLFFDLKAVQSLSGIEIVMARRFNRKPDFNNQQDSEQESRYRITLSKERFKWDKEDDIRRVFIEIWNQVFITPSLQKSANDNYSVADVRKLNKRLEKRRNHPRHPEHYYLSFTKSDYQENLAFISGIYEGLLSQLNEMTVIEYGSSDEESHLFIIPEDDVRESINMFYEEINGTLGSK